MSRWKEYNDGLNELNDNLIAHNEISQLNYIESGHYNHIRDILALTVSFLLDTNKNLKILDFGSNKTPWLNLKNRVETKELLVDIFDPFSSESQIAVSGYEKKLRFFNDINKLDNHYDLVILGSSIHYLIEPFSKLDELIRLDPKFILITHSPISLGDTFHTKPLNKHEGKIIVISISELEKYFENKDYKIIFKSILPKDTMTIPSLELEVSECINLLLKKR